METFCKFVKGMDDNVKGLITVMLDNKKKHLGRKYIIYMYNVYVFI